MRIIMAIMLCSSMIFAQKSELLSTEPIPQNYNAALSLDKSTPHQLKSMLELADNYSTQSPDSAISIFKKVKSLSSAKEPSTFYFRMIRCESDVYRLMGNYDTALYVLTPAITQIESIEDKALVANIYNVHGTINNGLNNLESAIESFLKCAAYYESIDDKARLGKLYANVSGIYFDQNNLAKSQEYTSKVIKYAIELKDDEMRMDAAGLQAMTWMTRGIYYYLKNAEDTIHLAETVDTLNYYFNISEKEFDFGVQLSKKVENKMLRVGLLNNFVALMLNMEKYDKAELLSLEAMQTAEEIGNDELIIQGKSNLSSFYRRTGNLKLAKEYVLESLKMARERKLDRKEFIAMRNLLEIYVLNEEWEAALNIQNKIRAYETKVADVDRIKVIANTEAKYQSALKENQILELEKNNTKIERQRNGIVAGSLLSGLLLFMGIRMRKIKRERNDKIELAKALLFTQEEERKRIAKDLHDGVGQTLLLIKKQMENNQNTSLENQSMISETLEEVRTISRGLHPFHLDKFGITATIKDLLEKISRSTDIFVTFDIVNIDGLIPKDDEIQLYRAIQEATNNIVKHSEASAARIDISVNDRNVLVEIKDNGKGFDHELRIVKTKSLGLNTMNERINSIGGKFSISRNDTKGMCIKMEIPKKA